MTLDAGSISGDTMPQYTATEISLNTAVIDGAMQQYSSTGAEMPPIDTEAIGSATGTGEISGGATPQYTTTGTEIPSFSAGVIQRKHQTADEVIQVQEPPRYWSTRDCTC